MIQLITVAVIALLIAADQFIKYIVSLYLAPVNSYCLINNFLSLTYIENTGAAFGSFGGHTVLLSVFTAAVLAVGLIYLLKNRDGSKFVYVCLTCIIAGGAANLIDRIFRGYVIDYIEPLFIDFAVFNFADILVTCGAIALIIRLLVDIIKKPDPKSVDKEGDTDE